MSFVLCILPLKQFSQYLNLPLKVISYNLNELNITENSFTEDFKKYFLKSQCPEIHNKTFRYFILKIEELSDCNSWSIMVEAYKEPYADENAIGYFEKDGYSFFIYGSNPNNIFKLTNRTKQFNYQEGGLPFIEEFPFWKFIYSTNTLTLEETDCW